MPEDFIKSYESEIAGNEKAKADLEKMRSIHSVLQEDARSKTVDKNFADASFERLMTKMSYAKTVRIAQKTPRVAPFAKYAASFAAAAAVFALAFVPVYNRGIVRAAAGSIAAIEIKKGSGIEPISAKQIVVDDSLKQSVLQSRIAVAAASTENEDAENSSAAEAAGGQAVEQKTVQASALVSSGNSSHRFSFTQVDPFKPDFSSSQIRISVPKFEEIRDNLE